MCEHRQHYTTESYIEKAKEVHNNFYSYDKTIFTKTKNKIIITCPIHGDFEQIAGDHIYKKCGCQKCKSEKTIATHSYNKDKWLEMCYNKFGNKFDYSQVDYVNYTTPVKIICPIHGEFYIIPKFHVESETGCAKCGREKANLSESWTLQQFIEKAKEVHGNKYDYSQVKYTNSSQKVTIICPKHGPFYQIPRNHIHLKQGCPCCKHSKGEDQIFNYLTLHNIKFKSQVALKCPTKINKSGIVLLDFLVKYNGKPCVIEYNGIQHYEYVPYFHRGGLIDLEKQQNRDKWLFNLCKHNNVLFCEIKYTENVEEVLTNLFNNEYFL